MDLSPGLGRSRGEGNGNPLQYSCLENSMVGGARQAPLGHKELDMTEGLSIHTHTYIHLWSKHPVPNTCISNLKEVEITETI